jgi:hypothetical protein
MAIYISPKNEYPRHDGDIRLEAPNWNPGDELPEGWIAVIPTEPPLAGEGKIVYELPPTETDGVFTQVFAIRDLTAEEIEARKVAEVRAKVSAGQPITADEAALLVG